MERRWGPALLCLGANGNVLLLPGVSDPNQCPTLNPTYQPNPNLRH